MMRGNWIAVGAVTVVVVAAGALAVVLASGGEDDELAATTTTFELPPWSQSPTTTTTTASQSTTTSTVVAGEPVFATGVTSPVGSFDVTLFVDPVDGSDDHTGLVSEEPLGSLARAMELATSHRAAGDSVHVVLAPGVYRETLTVGREPDDSPWLVVESAEPGGAVVSGADVWDGWQWSAPDDAFVHVWPFDWVPDPSVEEIVGRRELVVVDGVLLVQVVEFRGMSDGTFYVDTARGLIFLRPPSGMDFAGLSAEVAVRERAMSFDGARNVAVRGITFQHAANPFLESGVRITNSQNVLFESNLVVEHSWTGLGISRSEVLTVRGNEINRNGGGGATLFQTTDLVFDANDTSLNNWRGVRGEYIGWSIAGVKAVGVHEMVIRGHRAWGNSTRGLWLDYDIRDVSIEDSSWCHNLTDGLFLEAAQGPIVVSGSTACHNDRYGLLIVNVYGASLSENLVCNNGEAQIHVDAQPGGREVETAEGTLMMSAALDLTLRSNVVSGGGPLLRFSIPQQDFQTLLPTFVSEDNQWHNATGRVKSFDYPRGEGDLDAWRSVSGMDLTSSTEPPPPGVGCDGP